MEREKVKPIAVALDRCQRDMTHISDATEIWFNLKEALTVYTISNDYLKASFDSRFETVITEAHCLANMLDPRYLGHNLNAFQKERGMTFLNEICSSFISAYMKFSAKNDHYLRKLYTKEVLNKMSTLEWWEYFGVQYELDSFIKKNDKELYHSSM